MGRKKRKLIKPWCWYCNRDFEDEKILIHHQKAKHFKCPFCHRKLFTGPGLSIHCNAVHKEKIDKIPNALPHRSSMVIDIYGMAGIPEADLLEHERQKLGLDSTTGEDEPPEKMVRTEEPSTSFAPPPPPPIPFPFVPPVAGMMPYVTPAVPGSVQPFIPSGVIPAPPPPPPPPNTESTSIPEVSTTEAPTFPAYSEAEIAKNSAPKVVRPVSGVNGIEVLLIYPEEDLSLEELMAARPKYQEILKTALQPQPLQPALQNPGFIPPYMQLPRGVPATTTGIPLVPVQQPPYGAPGYPQTPWMGLPNVRF